MKATTFKNPYIKDEISILEDASSVLRFRTIVEPKGGQKELHFHSRITEEFLVENGVLTLETNEGSTQLKANQKIAVKPFTPHRFYNEGKNATQFVVTVKNPDCLSDGLRIMYGLVRDTKIGKNGLPKNILKSVVALYMMDAYSAKLPYTLQRLGFSMLNGIAMVLGYKKQLLLAYGK
ncbi:cupin domain-containing protein [Flavobacterium sp. ASW18X]|uniref:cupin domain-containing protein n=1 Tax=Flavobacterium sp. ASW18X TaxID=2572595 RepID=UPI0010AE9197|nr:cupin domain-containing protein [Flavobacterium sp. ASW18X]TKD60672.1 cupin domain-containing protein [Flavobacterium sp. ASW18X]